MHLISPITSFASAMPTPSPITDPNLVEDQLLVLLRSEQSYKVGKIPCQSPRGEESGDEDRLPYEEWRKKICQWSFKVVDHFHLDREVVSHAMNLLDRFLLKYRQHGVKESDRASCPCPSCQRAVDSRTFQLAAMTSLYLAIKLQANDGIDEHGSRSKKLRLISFVELSRGQFDADDLCWMERTLLETLLWKVNPPTPMMTVSYLLRLMPPHEAVPLASRNSYDLVLHVINELSRYLTELSVCLGCHCSDYHASQVAYAAILVSMDLLTQTALPLKVRDAFNTAVVTLSSSSEGTILTPHDEDICSLKDRLTQSFWPEMLMDEGENVELGHPISMAREFGLLNINQIYGVQGVMTCGRRSPAKIGDLEGSPICVSR